MRKITKPLLTAVSTFALLALTACGQTADPPKEGQQAASPVEEVKTDTTGRVIEIRTTSVANGDEGQHLALEPQIVSARTGDTIRFIPHASDHRAASIQTMLPEGAEGWEGAVGEEITYVLAEPGIYGFQCVPHYAAGSVGIIIVTDSDEPSAAELNNLEDARSADHPGRANPVFFKLFNEAEEQGLLD